jgi:hypothetical protein
MFQCNLEQMDLQYRRYCAEKSCDASKMYSRFSADDYIFHCLLKHNISVLNGKISTDFDVGQIKILWLFSNLPEFAPPYVYEIEFKSAQKNFTSAPQNSSIQDDIEGILNRYYLQSKCDTSIFCHEHELVPLTYYSIYLKIRLEYDGELYFLPVGSADFFSTEFLITKAAMNSVTERIELEYQILGYCPFFLLTQFNVSCNNSNDEQFTSTGAKWEGCRNRFGYTIDITRLNQTCDKSDIFIQVSLPVF